MNKIDNIELLSFSLNNPEPILDDYYIKKGNLVISDDPKKSTDLMLKNLDLIECISAYSFAKKSKNKSSINDALSSALNIVMSKNINFSEFVSFWPIVDISYSLFRNLEEDDQKEILEEIMNKYVELRHGLYSNIGYSATTLQVGKDAKAHKESGNLAIKKVSELLEKRGFLNSNTEDLGNFFSGKSKKYLVADKAGKKLFKKIIKEKGIKFKWSRGKENKMPDFLVRDADDIFIMEHKHMKEGGGGQNKQVNELIDFINFSENNKNVYYISFLDGLYFNLFTDERYLKKGKIYDQLKGIKKALSQNKGNYFVNTSGFINLIGK
mgnify:CR=1 FL=1